MLPTLPLGYSWVWRDYPGSLTLAFDTFRAMVKDVARSMDRNGCQALLIITAHAANPEPLKYTIRELADELEMRILRVCYPGLSEVMADADSEMWLPMNFHAEEFETSLMLHLRPDLVRMDRAVREYPPTSLDYMMSSLPMGALSESGVVGYATVASAERWVRDSPTRARRATASSLAVRSISPWCPWLSAVSITRAEDVLSILSSSCNRDLRSRPASLRSPVVRSESAFNCW